jgi:hypothetical protein
MLCAAFLKAELEFLKSDPKFVSAMQSVKTLTDFEHLSELAEQLLGAKGHTNLAAQQFRRDSRRNQQSPTQS